MAEEAATIPTVNIDVAKEREKPRLVSLLFFDYANATGNQKLNLLGVFDRIRVNPDTRRTHPFGIFIRVGQAFDGEIQMRIVDPEGGVVSGLDFTTVIPGDVERRPFQAQMLFMFQFNVTTEGVYWVDVSYHGESLGGAALLIEFKKSEESDDEHTGGDA